MFSKLNCLCHFCYSEFTNYVVFYYVHFTLFIHIPGNLAKRAKLLKPFPSGPFGWRIAIRRGTLSSIELIFRRESKRSGRVEELSGNLTTLHADDLPVR